jgi:ribosomal protein S18
MNIFAKIIAYVLPIHFKYKNNRRYYCHKCNQEIPSWIVKYFSKEVKKNFESLDNYVTEKGKIYHINCKKEVMKDGTTCIICEHEIGKRAICDNCLKAMDDKQ